MCNTITKQLIGNDLPWFASMDPQQAFEEALSRRSVTPGLQKYINNLTVLVYRAPEIVLLAVEFDKDFINKERVTVALMPPSQTPSV